MFKTKGLTILLSMVLLLVSTKGFGQTDRCGTDETFFTHTYSATAGLNSSAINNPFTWICEIDPCCEIKYAVLAVSLSANQAWSGTGGGPCDDLLNYYTWNSNSSIWAARLNPSCYVYAPLNTCSPQPNTVALSQQATKTFQLSAADLAGLNAGHKLKLFVEDDSKITSATLTVRGCCKPDIPQSECSTSFGLTGTTVGAPPSQFIVTASGYGTPPTWDHSPGCSFWWTVQDLTSGSAAVGVSDWAHDYYWYKYPGVGFPSLTFEGYTGNANTCSSTTTNSTPGIFLLGHKYRITRGTWNCSGWHTESKTIMMEQNLRSAKNAQAVVTEDKSYKPSQSDVDKMIKNIQAAKR